MTFCLPLKTTAQESGDSTGIHIAIIEAGQQIPAPQVRCVLQTYSYWEHGENQREALISELEAKTRIVNFYEANTPNLLELEEKRKPGWIERNEFKIGVFVGWFLAALTYHTAG